MKAKHGKSTFFVVMMTLLLCGVLAIGATYAFTVSSDGNNKYILDNPSASPSPLPAGSGHYNVDLISYGGDNDLYLIKGGTAQNANVFQDAFLCPGRTEIIYLKVQNNEKMPLQCSVEMKVDANGFNDALKCVLYEGDLTTLPESWNDFIKDKNVKMMPAAGTTVKLLDEAHLGESDGNSISDERCFALAIHMDEQASDKYQGKNLSVTFSVRVDSNHIPGTSPAPTE